MARKTSKPGRTLTVFFLALAVAYGLVVIGNTWKPELGLDLQGGTRITLIADGNPSTDNLKEARGIIDQRVNGSGVSEAEVTTQGNRFITVEIPGKNRQDLVDTVKRQAQLRFRLVACDSSTSTTCGTAAASTDTTGGITSGTGAQRAPLGFGVKKGAKTATATPTPTPSATASAPAATTTGSPSATASSSAPASKDDATFDAAVSFMNTPPDDWATKFTSFTCPDTTAEVKDDPTQPLLTCDPDGQVKYLLSPAIIEGTDLTDASFGIPQQQVNYVVTLDFNGHGRKIFADATGTIANTGQQFAIVLDGQVISAPTASSRISSGAQIEGNFTQAEAQSLSTSLKYGALPIAFKKDVTVEVVGPTLAGNQLQAGFIAGGIGLLLVALWCLGYYRGLGLVVLSSLVVAAAWTYALVLLLSKTAGFTLTLPGIAGLIIAVGITADSFIIFFERIRDEMRDGKSMRVAVESGWVRARQTRMAANVVQLLSAAVLYIFATGVVKGFGFALGLSTLLDLAVLFWFTKPMVTWLARFKFFNGGGAWSGLSVHALGVDPREARRARVARTSNVGGKA
ncbi:protein translocase subunit SecD [Nocardioides sp. Kera G14]|uniref:protein translocase subunit SecD n=1 Tax=Nocardioides sp. Kera G14 TaxID=2884264 RepID=UPI001D130384|nr:protein translocase subunit SecD [Nocardioides sp. Kera G14]UDY22178.1 protein translocase subunit SecD [Nocardioides sp. Kera G14]